LSETPIVALTASNSLEEAKRAYNVGMNAYLTKPVDKLALEEAIWKIEFCKKNLKEDQFKFSKNDSENNSTFSDKHPDSITPTMVKKNSKGKKE